jgi:ATP-binding cassette subfamily B protein
MMKNNTRKTLKIFWQKSLNYKISAFVIFASVFSASVIGVIVPLFYKKFFDILVANLDQSFAVKQLIYLLIVIGVLQLIAWCFWRFATFTANHFQSKVMTDLSNYCFAYLHQHSYSFFSDNFVGSLVKKVKWFSRAFETIADRITWNLFPLLVNISIIIFVLLTRSWILSLAVFIWIILFLLVNWIFTNYKLKYDILRSEAEPQLRVF